LAILSDAFSKNEINIETSFDSFENNTGTDGVDHLPLLLFNSFLRSEP